MGVRTVTGPAYLWTNYNLFVSTAAVSYVERRDDVAAAFFVDGTDVGIGQDDWLILQRLPNFITAHSVDGEILINADHITRTAPGGGDGGASRFYSVRVVGKAGELMFRNEQADKIIELLRSLASGG